MPEPSPSHSFARRHAPRHTALLALTSVVFGAHALLLTQPLAVSARIVAGTSESSPPLSVRLLPAMASMPDAASVRVDVDASVDLPASAGSDIGANPHRSEVLRSAGDRALKSARVARATGAVSAEVAQRQGQGPAQMPVSTLTQGWAQTQESAQTQTSALAQSRSLSPSPSPSPFPTSPPPPTLPDSSFAKPDPSSEIPAASSFDAIDPGDSTRHAALSIAEATDSAPMALPVMSEASADEPLSLIAAADTGSSLASSPSQGRAAERHDSAASAASDTGALSAASQTFKTRIPRSFTLRYEMQRGAFSGTGELRWRNEGQHYEAQLQGAIGGLTIMTWTSKGGFDAHGLAPLRYTDQRLTKAPQAANFQRAESKITFSGPSDEFPLVPGAQDRLSWMIQLPAILSADATKAKAGTRLPVYIVGARGDADTWVFQCEGNESVTTPSGRVQAVKWLREPRKPMDTGVEVWLDPARQYLPVRAQLTSSPSDPPLELRLIDGG
jgi:hypothetical protein